MSRLWLPHEVCGNRATVAHGMPYNGVQSFIPDACPYPYPSGSSMAEGVTVDAEGSVYGADFLGDVRKFVKK